MLKHFDNFINYSTFGEKKKRMRIFSLIEKRSGRTL